MQANEGPAQPCACDKFHASTLTTGPDESELPSESSLRPNFHGEEPTPPCMLTHRGRAGHVDMTHEDTYRHLLDVARHLGVAEIAYERQSNEVQLLCRLLESHAAQRDALRHELARRSWQACEGYVEHLLRADDSKYEEAAKWTLGAVEAMLRNRLTHSRMSIEGTFVRFYESARRAYAQVLALRDGLDEDDLEYEALDTLAARLAEPNHLAVSRCALFRHLRNDIVHRFGVANSKSEHAAQGVTFDRGNPRIVAGQRTSMRLEHAYALVRWSLELFREVTGVGAAMQPSENASTVFDEPY